MARYPQQHLEIPQIPMAVLAMDTIKCLLITYKGNRWALIAICLHTSYMLAVLMKETSAENVVQAYLSSLLLAHKGGSVAILSDNGTEFKNKVLNEVCDKLGIKRLPSNPFHPQGNTKVENVHNIPNKTSPNSWTILISSGTNSCHLPVIAIIHFLVAMASNLHSSLSLDEM